MRIAVISDIHSNVFALEAALGELNKKGYDKLVVAGDLVGNGLFPEETVSLCRTLKNCVFVKGNHDMFAACDFNPYKPGSDKYEFFVWQQSRLGEGSKRFLDGMSYIRSFTVFGKKIVCMHYPMKRRRFLPPKYLPTDEEFAKMFSGYDGDVFLFGHEHTGSLTESDGRYYFNFGTCGNFLEKDVARCGIVEVSEDGVRQEIVRARYDESKALRV